MIPQELLGFIKDGTKFLIAAHKESDGDAVGSQLALASVLRRMGKQALLLSPGPFKRSEIKPYEHLFHLKDILERERPGADTQVILLDCSAPDRVGDLEPLLAGLPKIVIDHHKTSKHNGALCYIDENAPSTTFMLIKLIHALGMEPTREEAEFLFFGLCTDTGFFRHLDSGGAEAFEAAADLIRSGANPKAAYAAIHSGKSLNSMKLLGRILERAEPHYGGKLIFSYSDYEDMRCFGIESRNSDNLYQLLQSVGGVEVMVILKQETPKNCSVGFRSRDAIDVGLVAEAFGGGGHKNASGCYLSGTVDKLKPLLLKAFESLLA